MTDIKEVVVDFKRAEFPTIQDVRKYVETKVDSSKSCLVLSNLTDDEFLLPLIDMWLSQFPGRLFRSSTAGNLPQVLLDRVPEKEPKTCWSGNLFYSNEKWTKGKIMNPVKPDRVPLSENLFILGSLSDEQKMHVPVSSGRTITCVVADTFLDFDNSLVIAPSEQDTRLYFMTAVKRNEDSVTYQLCSIQSPSVFASVYKAALAEPAPLQHAHYLRAIGMGHGAPSAVLVKKQLNVMTTVARMQETIFPFFAGRKPSKRKSTTDDANFENSVVNKRVNKLGKTYCQKDIDNIFRQLSQETGTLEDVVYAGKRYRRLLGTSFNSHKWPLPPIHVQSVDAPLLSEVVGELNL